MNRYNYITLLEILNQDAFVPIEGLPVHDTPGWAYAGYCTWVSCFSCSTTGLDIWRKPSENTHYRYWGIFCRDCERLTDLRSYKGSQLASLKEWSKERQPPFTLRAPRAPFARTAIKYLTAGNPYTPSSP